MYIYFLEVNVGEIVLDIVVKNVLVLIMYFVFFFLEIIIKCIYLFFIFNGVLLYLFI